MKISDNIHLYIFILLTGLFLGASYFRFVVIHDYYVTYEGLCDPTENSCFIGCEDEECVREYYYAEVEKYAADLYAQCGNDIIGCEEANFCLPEEVHSCSITYCETEISADGCEKISEIIIDLNDVPYEVKDLNSKSVATTTHEI